MVCNCNRIPKPGERFNRASHCSFCTAKAHEASPQSLVTTKQPDSTLIPIPTETIELKQTRSTCRHLDEANPVNRHGCGTCPTNWTYPCEVYGACTPKIERSTREQTCSSCPSYQPDDTSLDLPIPTPLVLVNKLCPGDVLVMTAAVESLHLAHPNKYITDVETTAPEIWENNPRARRLTGQVRTKARHLEMNYPLVHQSDQRPVHFLQGYTDFLAEELGHPIPTLTNRPHLFLSEEEKKWLPQVHEETKQPTKYWILNAGTKPDFTAKGWGADNYQEVVNQLKGQVTFVQIGEKHHNHPTLKGVINLVGKTTTRQLIRACYHAQGGLGPSTFIQHIFAAYQKPYVLLLGGREPQHWTAYTSQRTLSTHGALTCCRDKACWKSRTVKLNDGNPQDSSLCTQPTPGPDPIPRCLALISPADTVRAIQTYMNGDALSK